MEFVTPNVINTTTQIYLSSNSLSASYIFNRNLDYQYYTDGFDNDNTTASITIQFEAPTDVSRIAILGKNFKEYRFFYDGLTANSIPFVGFSTSSFADDEYADVYFQFPTLTVNSITLDMKSTINANEEKVLDYLFYGDAMFTLTPTPNAANFKLRRDPKQVIHKLSDGGTRIQNISNKWIGEIKMKYIDETMKDYLEDTWFSDIPFNFVPFGTATAWDAVLFEAVWPGDFEFYEYADNNKENHYMGTIRMEETPI